MATETLLSDHHSPDKTMEVFEETQTVKLEDVDPPKEVGGKDEEEKLDADGLAGSETPVNKLEETTGMQTKLPTAVEVEKVDDAPVVDVHVEADSEKLENCALNPESLSASGMGDGAVETQSGDPEKCIVVEKVENPSLVDVPAEVDLKVVVNSVLDPESDSASKPGETPEEHSVDVLKVDDGRIVDIPTETGSKVVENSVLEPEPSSASEPGGEIFERQLEAPKGDTTEVEKVDVVSVADVLAEAGPKVVENSVLEPESSPSEPIGVAAEKLSEEHPTVVEKVDDAAIVDVPCEASLEVVENSVLEPESSPSEPIGLAAERLSEEHPTVVEKVDDAAIVDVPCKASLEVVENSVLEPESSPSEPIGLAAERLSEEHDTVVEKADDATIVDVPCEASLEVVENSVLEPESSPSEPIGVAAERLSEEHPTVVEKVDDATIVDVPCEASLEVVENSVLDPESSSASKPGDEIVERQREALEEHPVEVEKVDNIPIVDFPAEAGVKTIENSFVDAESSSPSEPGGATVQRQLEATNEHSTTEMVETQQQEQVAGEAIEQPEEKPSVGTAEPDSSIEAVDKLVEHLEVIPVKESELEVAKVPEAFSEAECKIAESPGLVTTVEGETGERAEVIKGFEGETEEIKPSESLGGEVMTSEGTMADKCEGNESLKEETSLDQEPVAYENSVPTNEEAQVDPKEEEGYSSTFDVIEKAAARATDKEGAGGDVVERLSKDETVVAAMVEEEKEEKIVKIEDSEGTNTKVEESIQTETAKTYDRNGSNFVAEVAEIDREQVSRDVEEVAEVKKLENVEEDIPLSVEADKKNVKIEDSEGKNTKVEESIQTETAKTDDRNGSNFVAEVAEIDREQVSRDVEVVAEVKKLENVEEDIPLSVEADKDKDGEGKLSEVDAKETVKTNADNLESAKTDGEIAKSNPPNLETLKNGDDSKTSAKPPKQDDPVKKHSNNLISKVKQSIVKVKKAITGKSPSPKALLPEAKGDEKVK
ncbi:nuclear autoantigenic sperm protein-like isoform X5 [Vitis riparia]|uniref:nuclear autoantigenic sperm protein-like isoform X5 n=1 Tax=Vitis riparia TaxID=96939 RepID=UPI00155AACD3|nr:nuclear autoantigenic sperm protein-like isoform X5 [Vitis riparia]